VNSRSLAERQLMKTQHVFATRIRRQRGGGGAQEPEN
jgi:hypothetical protein